MKKKTVGSVKTLGLNNHVCKTSNHRKINNIMNYNYCCSDNINNTHFTNHSCLGTSTQQNDRAGFSLLYLFYYESFHLTNPDHESFV
jgi:hypothetical protein